MPKLKPITPLGGTQPQSVTIGTVTICENVSMSLASLTMRSGKQRAFLAASKKTFKTALPAPQMSTSGNDWQIMWTAPDQYFVAAPMDDYEDIARDLGIIFKDSASITEQSGGWVRFEIEGDGCLGLLERLCAVDVRAMESATIIRTVMEHLGVFLLCNKPHNSFTIYGASASAQSLFHGLNSAATSIR